MLEWILLLAALGALTITEEYRWYVGGAVAALAASFVVRAVRMGRTVPRTGMEGPALLFVAAAGIGLWAAYDRPLAALHLARVLAMLALFYAVADSPERSWRFIAGGFVAAAAMLAVYWPLQHDFSAQAAKLGIIAAIGKWINALAPNVPGPSIHANVAGGVLLLALPFAAGLARHEWRRRREGAAVLAALLGLVVAGGLFLTGNRGGWLAVAAMAAAALLARFQRRRFSKPRQRAVFWGLAAGIVLLLFVGVAATGNLDAVLGMVPDPTGAMQGRVSLWSQGLSLIRDYGFTGIGLGMFPMVFSVYGVLIDTPFVTHIHNTWLEVWIETGGLGIVALLWGGLAALMWGWRALGRKGGRSLAWAGLAACLALAVHGIFDSVFFGTRMLPLAGLALGFAWISARNADPAGTPRSLPESPRRWTRWVPVLAAEALLVLLVVILHRPLLGAWHANLGAVAQARVELNIYDPAHFDDPTLDLVRQKEDLGAAEREYARALRWDAGNLTAQQRLAALALSRAQYNKGLAAAQALWARGHRDDITRLLLGDALVAAGQPEAAADTVRGLNWAEMRLRGHAWYRYWLDKDYRRAADAWTTAIMLNPDGTNDLLYWQAEAEKRAK